MQHIKLSEPHSVKRLSACLLEGEIMRKKFVK